MTLSRHARVRDIFLAASEQSTANLEPFLDQACGGDDDLRREVESLLHHHEDPTQVEPASRSTRPGRRRRTRFEAGHVFAGRYRIVNELGRGGMGEVFRAHDLVLDEPVAIKFLPATGRQHLEQLLNEVRMARQVSHPNVCRVFDFGDADGETFLTMEYVDGENLGSLLGRIGRLPQDKLLELAHQLTAGLAAAHHRGVLHRDLKPANIMIDGRGRVRITDFGIATTGVDAIPTGGARAGTPAYMAPEQLANGEVSEQSDLYSLGLVLHEMATGRPVFEAETPAAYAELHRSATPTPPSRQVDHLDPVLEAVIVQCLEKDPRARPASAKAALAELPGGDRLQLALDAGETPSPEVVAAAGRNDALQPFHAWALAALLVILLGTFLGLGDRAFPGRNPWVDTPPEVLINRADIVLSELGLEFEAVDRAWGFVPNFDVREDETGLFWYRQGTSSLEPEHLFAMEVPRIDFWDPPPHEAGMIRLLLDPKGNLTYLHAVPKEPEEEEGKKEEGKSQDSQNQDSQNEDSNRLETPPSDTTPPLVSPPKTTQAFDWNATLRAAGFDLDTLQTTTPRKTPPLFADQRAAWTARRDNHNFQLEAAAREGAIVFFEAVQEEPEEPESFFDFYQLWEGYLSISQVLRLLLVVAAIVLARLNLRAGRGDLRGARRVVLIVIAMNLVAWVLEADHLSDVAGEIFLFEANLSRILRDALIVWLAYIALEPTVRRWWPRALIAWNRLLHGRLNDPLVGKSLLIGSVTGTWWALATQLDRLITQWLELEDAGELFILSQLESALSGRLLFARILTDCIQAAGTAVLDLFFLVALRVVFKRWWLAIVLFVVANGLLETLEGIHPAVSWATLGLGIAGVTAFILVRFGLLAYACALFCYYVLLSAPITLQFEAWFAETGLFVLVLIAAIGALSLRAALIGRPMATALDTRF